jgi:hypothetical protein
MTPICYDPLFSTTYKVRLVYCAHDFGLLGKFLNIYFRAVPAALRPGSVLSGLATSQRQHPLSLE